MMKEEILKLRLEGLSYRQIVKKLGCSLSTVSYHCGEGQKEKTIKRLRKYRDNNTLSNKISTYRCKTRDFKNSKTLRKLGKISKDSKFNAEDVIDKFGINPVCYLSGRKINLHDTKSFHFDHIKPISKGGLSTLDNLGITTREANLAKSDLHLSDLLKLCEDILIHNGYKVSKQ